MVVRDATDGKTEIRTAVKRVTWADIGSTAEASRSHQRPDHHRRRRCHLHHRRKPIDDDQRLSRVRATDLCPRDATDNVAQDRVRIMTVWVFVTPIGLKTCRIPASQRDR